MTTEQAIKFEADIPLNDIIAEAQERYHVFFIIPYLTSHYGDAELEKYWQKALGQQNILMLEDPTKICELIASTVAITEEHVGLSDLETDGVIDPAMSKALAPLAAATKDVSKLSVGGLTPVDGSGGADRL